MAKMLARSGYLGAWGDEVLVGAHGQARKLKRRIQRQREAVELRREVDAYPDDLTEGKERRVAQYGWEIGDPLYDWSDCRHGCNGDCVTGGSSERCTFVCHGGPVDVDHERTLAYIAEYADA
jgi:hypothetical protein